MAAVQKTDTGWGFIHPFSKTFKGGFPSRAAARSALAAVKGGPAVVEEPEGEEPVVVATAEVPTKAEVDEAFEAITGVPRPGPVDMSDPPEPEPVVPVTLKAEEAFPADRPPVPSTPKAPKASKTPDAVNGYRLKVTNAVDRFMRREQPRKPGDVATYKIVEVGRATVIKTLRQAEVKVTEVNTLYPDIPVTLVPVE